MDFLRALLTPQKAKPKPTPKAGSGRCENYWKEQGWVLKGDLMEGHYRTIFVSVKGFIRIFHSGKHQFYILAPPNELRYHAHWPCFVHKGENIYWIHFDIEPDCVDTGIITIEKIIREAKVNFQQRQ